LVWATEADFSRGNAWPSPCWYCAGTRGNIKRLYAAMTLGTARWNALLLLHYNKLFKQTSRPRGRTFLK
jgi:hypothetical protein